MRVAETIELNPHDEHTLRVLAKRKRVEVRVQQRARIILLAAQHKRNRLRIGRDHVPFKHTYRRVGRTEECYRQALGYVENPDE